VQLVADDCDGVCDEVAFFMQNADFDGALAAALDLALDSGQERGAGVPALAATDRREIDCGAAESIAAGEGGPLVAACSLPGRTSTPGLRRRLATK